jgi:carbamoyl-phosphate synthase large subunit
VPVTDPTDRTDPGLRVLVTGAGGPAGVNFLRMVTRPGVTWFAADIDPVAFGLYLVPADQRVLLPRGDDPAFAETMLELCRDLAVDVVVPTVDSELLPLAGRQAELAGHGVRLLSPSSETLEVTLDKWRLVQLCRDLVRVPASLLWTGAETLDDLHRAGIGWPLIAKPRRGSGSTGVYVMTSYDELARLPTDGSQLLQELLPGEEFSVDVLVRSDHVVVAAVPRTRDRIDSGVAIAGRTVHDEELIAAATAVAGAIGLVGIGNVQFRRAVDGTPGLLEVNPRVPGTLTLTAAAGVDMCSLALADVLGEPVPRTVTWKEVAVVRYLEDVVVPIDDYRRTRNPEGPPR